MTKGSLVSDKTSFLYPRRLGPGRFEYSVPFGLIIKVMVDGSLLSSVY